MLKDIKGHYLDLITGAIEAGGSVPLLRARDADRGVIYVARDDNVTEAEYALGFHFDDEGVTIAVQFFDGRAPVKFETSYALGLDGFFPAFMKALRSNRLENKAA